MNRTIDNVTQRYIKKTIHKLNCEINLKVSILTVLDSIMLVKPIIKLKHRKYFTCKKMIVIQISTSVLSFGDQTY